jgi:hypothetical protein
LPLAERPDRGLATELSNTDRQKLVEPNLGGLTELIRSQEVLPLTLDRHSRSEGRKERVLIETCANRITAVPRINFKMFSPFLARDERHDHLGHASQVCSRRWEIDP